MMPSSTWVHISDVVEIAVKANPRSILDVGCGWGRWGMLFRELLDVGKRRYHKKEWKVVIDGVEPFGNYITPVHWHVYDMIRMCTIQEFFGCTNERARYDMIMVGDVLEHLPTDEAVDALRRLTKMANICVVVAVPLGLGWEQGSVNGNAREAHIGKWSFADMLLLGDIGKVYQAFGKPYGVFVKFPGKVKLKLRGFSINADGS